MAATPKFHEAIQLNEDIRLLLWVVLHDMSNDLMRATCMADKLKAQFPESEFPDRLSIALSSVSDLIGQLKKLHHSGEIVSDPSDPVAIRTLIDKGILRFWNLLKHQQVKLELSGDLDVKINGPMVILSASIFNNLFSNSIKFSSPSQNVKITVKEDGRFVVVTVTNIGPPTDKAGYLAAITGNLPENLVQHAKKGDGLGLIIAAHFCKRLGIDINGEQSDCGDSLITSTVHLKIPKCITGTKTKI